MNKIMYQRILDIESNTIGLISYSKNGIKYLKVKAAQKYKSREMKWIKK